MWCVPNAQRGEYLCDICTFVYYRAPTHSLRAPFARSKLTCVRNARAFERTFVWRTPTRRQSSTAGRCANCNNADKGPRESIAPANATRGGASLFIRHNSQWQQRPIVACFLFRRAIFCLCCWLARSKWRECWLVHSVCKRMRHAPSIVCVNPRINNAFILGPQRRHMLDPCRTDANIYSHYRACLSWRSLAPCPGRTILFAQSRAVRTSRSNSQMSTQTHTCVKYKLGYMYYTGCIWDMSVYYAVHNRTTRVVYITTLHLRA